MLTVILAGGKGTRIMEETINKPKALVNIGDKPIIRHIMDFYISQNHRDFLVLTGYKSECISDYFKNTAGLINMAESGDYIFFKYETMNVGVLYTGEDTESAQRVKMSKPYIKSDNFMLTYCDGLSSVNIDELLNMHSDNDFSVTLSAVHPKPRYGVLDIEPNGKVADIREKSMKDSPLINGGFMVLKTEVLDFIEDKMAGFESDFLPYIAKEKILGAYVHNGFWQSMDTLFEKEYLCELYKQEDCPWIIRTERVKYDDFGSGFEFDCEKLK